VRLRLRPRRRETKVSNVRIITTALSETIDTWSTFAEAEDRTRLAELIDAARTKPIDFKTDENLTAMASALKAAE
jgi:hypothetical protein